MTKYDKVVQTLDGWVLAIKDVFFYRNKTRAGVPIIPPRFYYLMPGQFELVFRSAFITPDRFITVVGLMLAIVGLIFSSFFNLTNGTPEEKVFKFSVGVSIFAVILFISLYISFFLTRKDTNDFTKVLSNTVQTDKFIRYLAFEILVIIQAINARKTGEGIRLEIGKRKNELRTVESLKKVLAKRLMISHRALSDDFLRFSATVYVNRQIHRASLLDYFVGKTYEKSAVDVELVSVANHIKTTLARNESHLYDLVSTNMDLAKIEPMFQTRSVSTVTLYLISILHGDREELFRDKSDNFKLLNNIQKAHRTGVAIYRAIGVAIIIYLAKMRKAVSTEEQMELRNELLVRACSVDGKKPNANMLNALNGIHPYPGELDLVGNEKQSDGMLAYLNGWFFEAQDLYKNQRKRLRRMVGAILRNKIRTISSSKPADGKIYILVSGYSRQIHYIFDSVLKRRDLLEKEFKDVYIVVLVEGENQDDFGARLMFHHLTSEYRGESALNNKTWRSTSEAFMSRFDASKDHMIALKGCDRIGHSDKSKQEKNYLFGATGDSTRSRFKFHCHNDTAYLPIPIGFLDDLKEANGGKMDVFIVGGSYKYDLKILIDHIEDEDLACALRNSPRKRRRSGLHEWKSGNGFDVTVISVPLSRIVRSSK